MPHFSDDDGGDSDSLPAHVRARDEAVSEAFALISRGGTPCDMSLNDASTYTAAVERNCVRELVGIITDWRPPFLDEWRAYPEIDEDVIKKQHNVLIACVRTGGGEPSIALFVVYGGRHGDSPEMNGLNVLAQQRQKLLRSRVLGHATRDVYVEIAYVGDIVSGLSAARQLEWRDHGTLSGIARVLAGGARVRQEWRRVGEAGQPDELDELEEAGALTAPEAPEATKDTLNEPQRAALEGLGTNVELIHGPPGSGKTHTISTLVTQYFSDSDALVLSAVQNRAIEAIAEHFVKAGLSFVTAGRRTTGLCNDWTLEAQLTRHPDVVARQRHLHRVQTVSKLLQAGVKRLERLIHKPTISERWQHSHRARTRTQLVDRLMATPSDEFRRSLTYVNWRIDHVTNLDAPAAQRKLRALAEEHARTHVNPWPKAAAAIVRERYASAAALVNAMAAAADDASYRLDKERETAEQFILERARALLVTTASLGGAVRNAGLRPLTKRIKAIVVDEAGTVADRHLVPVLVECPLKKILLVGDTRQLPVFTTLRGADAAACSTMQRLEERGVCAAMLSVQYRMPRELGNLVSKCFYNGELQTETQQDAAWPDTIRVRAPRGRAESESEHSTSVRNRDEASEVVRVVRALVGRIRSIEDAAERASHLPIAVLSTYAAQIRLLSTLLVPEERDGTVELLSVDSAQGREWKHVVFSTVTTDPRHTRFVRDPRRLCVALSRAKRTLTLVSHPTLVARVPVLGALRAAAHADDAHVDTIADRIAALRVRPAGVGAGGGEAGPGEAGPGGGEGGAGDVGRCPITIQPFEDPVVAADGHTYERSAVERWFAGGNRTSPLTGARLQSTTLIPNHAERSRSRR
jgi:hypothetical protein